MNNYIALILTFVLSLIFLRSMDFIAHRGWMDSKLSRKIIHIGTGPLFVLCWFFFNDDPSARWLAAAHMHARLRRHWPAVVAGLPELGFRALSVFGPEKAAPLRMVNTHVDLIDWRGSRGGRPDEMLLAELMVAMDRGAPVGLLTQHLVHDAQAWDFIARLFDMTADHPGCRWTALPDLVRSP